ncbi:MAG TPA: DPP IV N-terminal domain-containing protein [Bryobacteraceae bacterium]|nr:DPP IV N-terminal domain-containing protein [Bryobacteraceae bacterium]
MTRRFLLFVALVLVVPFKLSNVQALLGQQTARKPVTLDAYEQWRSRPAAFPSEPVWSPAGISFAYRENGQLHIYDLAEHRPRALVRLDEMSQVAQAPPASDGDPWENRRVLSQPISWSPRGTEILYATVGDLFLVDAKSGKWRQLTKTPAAEADPKFSPDGSRIAFRRAWDLYALDLSSGKETRLTSNGSDTLRNGGVDWVYPEELDLGTAYWWSPDSRSILYLQFNTGVEPQYPHASLLDGKPAYQPQRYPQAGDSNALIRPGVVSATGGPTKWLDAGDTVKTYLIARAGWTPDSRHVWIARTNRVQNRLEMLLFDAANGTSKTVYRESDPAWINIEGEPVFLKDSSGFLWTSERDGFRHLYRFPLDGGKPKQLTQGPWEVTSISCWDLAGGQAYYVSTEAGFLERQLYRIALDGSGKRRVTEAPGSHRISMAPGCRNFLDTHSSLQTPPETALRSSDDALQSVIRPANRAALEEFDLQIPEIVSFEGPGKTQLYGRLIKPPGFDPSKKYPLMVDVYGGPHEQSARDAWAGVTLDQVFAQRGYLVWQMDNRGTSGRGHAFERAIYRDLGKVEREDQRAGVEYLISLGFVDPARIGVQGWSYGGFMTLNLLLNAPDLFRAGFAGAPVTNWRNYDTIYTERYMGLPGENEDGYRESALTLRASHLSGRLMIAHNMEDDNVLFQNTLQFATALQAAGRQFEMQIYGGRSHAVTGPNSRQMDAAMVDFFDRSLAVANPR